MTQKTLKERILEMRNNGESIHICCIEIKQFEEGKIEEVTHWIPGEEETVKLKPFEGFDFYSHGLCNECLEKYYPET